MKVFSCNILTMLKPTVIFTVLIIFLSVQRAQSRALKSLNIQGILNSLQQQLELEQLAEKKKQQFPVEVLKPDQDYYSYFIRSSNKKQSHQDRDDSEDRDDDDDDEDDRRDDESPQRLQQLERVYDKQSRDLEKLLNKQKSANSLAALLDDRSDDDRDNRHHESRPVKKPRLNSALASLLDDREDDVREDRLQDLKSYKSVYLVLDPEAVETSHNKDKLGDLLSKLLNNRDRKERKKERHYQGFEDNNFSGRRKGRDSKENDSPERDFKPPKRSRPERSGGGGGGGGYRTAIPYRGHRGDIYERDN